MSSDSSWFVLVGGFVAALLFLAGIPAFLSYLGVEPDSGRPVVVEQQDSGRPVVVEQQDSGRPVVVEQQDDFDPFGITLDNPLAPILYPGIYPDWY